ncbi:MAG: hypothetical protein ACTSQJ_00375 [Promethearchaeota archaeon]
MSEVDQKFFDKYFTVIDNLIAQLNKKQEILINQQNQVISLLNALLQKPTTFEAPQLTTIIQKSVPSLQNVFITPQLYYDADLDTWYVSETSYLLSNFTPATEDTPQLVILNAKLDILSADLGRDFDLIQLIKIRFICPSGSTADQLYDQGTNFSTLTHYYLYINDRLLIHKNIIQYDAMDKIDIRDKDYYFKPDDIIKVVIDVGNTAPGTIYIYQDMYFKLWKRITENTAKEILSKMYNALL